MSASPAMVQPPPQPRKPLKYKKPSTSWVTVVILGFAAVGMAAVGGTTLKKLMATDTPAPSEVARKAITYSQLAKDDAVLVTVQVTPRDARLMVDGEPAVSNPLRLPRSPAKHRLTASAPGYEPIEQELTAERPHTVHLRLRKQP